MNHEYRVLKGGAIRGGKVTLGINEIGDVYQIDVSGSVKLLFVNKGFQTSISLPRDMLSETYLQQMSAPLSFRGMTFTKVSGDEIKFVGSNASGKFTFQCDGIDPVFITKLSLQSPIELTIVA